MSRFRMPCPRRVLSPLCAVALMVGMGCRPDTPGVALVPSAGTLFVNGKPASAATLTLHAKGSDARPVAVVDANGDFHLTTRVSGDGAPEGEYAVAVQWNAVASGKRPVAEGDPVAVRSLVPAAYTRPETSPLKVKVTAAGLEPAKLEITGR